MALRCDPGSSWRRPAGSRWLLAKQRQPRTPAAEPVEAPQRPALQDLLDRVSLRIAARQCRHFGPESTLRLLVNHDGILRHILILAQRACSARRQAWRPAPLTARRGATRRWAVPPNERPTGSP